MSGSYDKPPRGGPPVPPPQAPRVRGRQSEWTGPVSTPYTGPPSTAAGVPPSYASPSDSASEPRYADWQSAGDPPRSDIYEPDATPYPDELRADDSPAASGSPTLGPAPIVPAGSVTSNSLTLVISIMCFLACLTSGAVYMVNQTASAWLSDIASEVTVQIEPREKVDTERVVKDVTQFIARQPGIRTVKPMSLNESTGLIEPWLGQSEALKTLPVPRLIAIEVDRSQPPDFGALRHGLLSQFPRGVILDDHRHWQQQIRTVTRSLALGGLAILMLVGAATTAIIISAARSAMASNREIVEVLHFVGANDRFIAGEFERHFQRLGIRAGLVGAVCALLVFVLLPTSMELLGGGTVTIAEIQRLVGVGALDALGYGVLAVVVVVISVLCRLTSRFGVYRILNSQQ